MKNAIGHELCPELMQSLGLELHDAPQLPANLRRLGLRHDRTLQALHLGKHRHVRRRAHAVPLRQAEVQHRILSDGIRQNICVNRTVSNRLLHCLSAFSNATFNFTSAASKSSKSSSSDFSAFANSNRNVR